MQCSKFQAYLSDQLYQIQQHCWLESEKAGRDLGQDAVKDWITRYSARYRAWWESVNGPVFERRGEAA